MERIVRYIIWMLLFSTTISFAQNNNFELYKGNKLYADGKFEQAVGYYNQALEKNPNDHRAQFNLGNGLFRAEHYEKAENYYKTFADIAPTNKEVAAAYHNLGNTYLLQKKIDPAIEAYKNALRKNPHDDATRYNLVYAMQLKNQQDQNQSDQSDSQDNNQDQEKNENQEKQDQNNEGEGDQNEDQQNDENNQDAGEDEKEGESKENKDPQDKKEEQVQPQNISKEQAEKMLDAINQQEKDIKAKLEEQNAKEQGKRSDEKDW